MGARFNTLTRPPCHEIMERSHHVGAHGSSQLLELGDGVLDRAAGFYEGGAAYQPRPVRAVAAVHHHHPVGVRQDTVHDGVQPLRGHGGRRPPGQSVRVVPPRAQVDYRCGAGRKVDTAPVHEARGGVPAARVHREPRAVHGGMRRDQPDGAGAQRAGKIGRRRLQYIIDVHFLVRGEKITAHYNEKKNIYI